MCEDIPSGEEVAVEWCLLTIIDIKSVADAVNGVK